MSPSFYSRLSVHLWRFRWHFFVLSILSMALYAVTFFSGSTLLAMIGSVLVGPLAFVPWCLFLVCGTFHPEHGGLYSKESFYGRLPRMFATFLRWYAAVFFSILFIAGAVIWPVTSF